MFYELAAKSQKQHSPRVIEASSGADLPGLRNLPVGSDQDDKSLLESYTKHPYVYSSVYEISQSAAGLPVKINLSIGEDAREVTDGPIIQLLQNPNPYQSRADLWEQHFIAMETVGKSFWEIVPMVDDRPIGPGNPIKEIYFLRPDKVKIYKDPKTFISHYIYHVNNLRIPIPAERVIYFRYHNPVDEYGGLGSVEPAKQSVIADLYCMSWNSSFFENGAVPEGMFLTDRPMPDELFKRFKREIEERWRPGKWRKPLIADNVKWQATTTSPRDMDFLELRKENLEAVLAATGVPKLQIGKSEQINKATAEVEERLFWSKTMLPKLAKFERALNRSLLPAFGENLELTHDTSRIEVLRSNHSELRGSLKNAVGVPFLTVNEARREYADATGRPYEDIEDGDIIYSPGIVLPLGDDLLGEPDIEEEQKTLLIAGKKKQLAARKNGGKPLMLAQPGMNPSSQGFYDEI